MLEYDITYTILVDVVDSVVRLQREGQPLFLAQSSWLAHEHKPPPTVHDFAASTHPQMRSNASFAVTRFRSYIANRVSEVPKSFNFWGFEYLERMMREQVVNVTTCRVVNLVDTAALGVGVCLPLPILHARCLSCPLFVSSGEEKVQTAAHFTRPSASFPSRRVAGCLDHF